MPRKRKKPSIIDPYEIRKIHGKFISKPMIFLLNAAMHFEKMAVNTRSQWSETNPPDQNKWWAEKFYAGAAFLHYSLYCEALVNNVWDDFKIRNVADLPDYLTKNIFKKDEDMMLPFKDRLWLTPYLCIEIPDYNKEYFCKNSLNFQKIIEIFQIRDSYVHPKSTERDFKITLRSNKIHHVDDSAAINIWQRTGIAKDITIMGATELPGVKEASQWLFSCLDNFLNGALNKKKWNEEESIKLDDGTISLGPPL